MKLTLKRVVREGGGQRLKIALSVCQLLRQRSQQILWPSLAAILTAITVDYYFY